MSTVARKKALVAELAAKLRAELDAMERAQRATVEGATSEEAKPENDKDTRALEQSYLARGQARRVEDLREGVARVTAMPVRAFADDAAIALGALVTIDEDDGTSVLFIAPYGGGMRLESGEQVVTPASPLGQSLIGKVAGDDCEVVLAGRTRAFSISEVA
ncbi:MAG: GreA/GreB family elongation factor [Myxococcales bacterium]|nr:GreA/GreB family elongation factor [Myxococcales bacterium]